MLSPPHDLDERIEVPSGTELKASLRAMRSAGGGGVLPLVRDSWEGSLCLSWTLLPKGLTPIQADPEIANSDSLART
ncbi:hypothetical protein Taro_024972 [Colocasia esculenta]|uniref:Uncharacterized protein n=1 Tax=Colocasia esculenta TaxID=4460 RepID=A0A843VLZ4_COLES|nr:hypothetical protein [Colocasia esculenta]